MNIAANLKVLAGAILAQASSFEWSLQGMGMLRLHLPGNYRLHVWDSRYRVPNVSMIHDHLQWGLESTIIAGKLTNRRYVTDRPSSGSPLYHRAIIKPGVGGGIKNAVETSVVALTSLEPEVWMPGDTYSQQPYEVHESDPEDGTVTLMRKRPTGDESAWVFWPIGTEWVSAEPRRATPEEVQAITQHALARWF